MDLSVESPAVGNTRFGDGFDERRWIHDLLDVVVCLAWLTLFGAQLGGCAAIPNIIPASATARASKPEPGVAFQDWRLIMAYSTTTTLPTAPDFLLPGSKQQESNFPPGPEPPKIDHALSPGSWPGPHRTASTQLALGVFLCVALRAASLVALWLTFGLSATARRVADRPKVSQRTTEDAARRATHRNTLRAS